MKLKVSVLNFGLAVVLAMPMHPRAAAAPLPLILQEIEKKYSQAGTVKAEFVQDTLNTLTARRKVTSGKIFAKRPSKVRWETLKPEASYFVSDGVKSWYYVPPFDATEPGQLIEKKAAETQSKLANALLAGSFSTVKGLKVQQKSSDSFLLIPKKGTAGTVQEALVHLDVPKKLIKKISLLHRGGNRADITLEGVELGAKLGNELFVFVPPQNTQRVEEGEEL